ncbi:MAG: S8 family serine peptidase [Bacteroidia bacterium]|nr:S8 family serine peptidase [Bacteroidia bacterium]
MKHLLIFAALACTTLAFGQTEVNVQLSPNQSNLRATFIQYQLQELSAGDIQTTARASLPWLDKLTYIEPLTKGGIASRSPLRNWFTLRLSEDEIPAMQASGVFSNIEPNRSYQLDKVDMEKVDYIPNDDSLSQQWHHNFIQSFKAWDITRGNPNVKIGVIDTGLDFEHPEFEGQVWVNPAEDANGNGKFDPWPADETRNGITGDFNGVDADGNGFVDDVVGYDFTDQPRSPFGGDFLFEDPYPFDDNIHGTAVSGVIHAKANNQIGIAGVAPDCKLVVLRAFAQTGGGEDDDISRAIIYAADNGVDVLNLSFGDNYPSIMMHEAIKYAYNKGVTMVSSAGNGSGDDLHYPSNYSEVISVSASTYNPTNNFESLWPLSSYGLTVDLCAPGADILTTSILDTSSTGEVRQYLRIQGTSFAAPMVAATAGLLISQRGKLSPQQLRGILTSSTDDISEVGWDHFTGAGRLNIFKALRAAGTSRVQISSPVNDGGSAKNEVAVIGTVLDPEFLSYHIEYQAGTEGQGDWISIKSDQNRQIIDDTLAIWQLDTLAEGEYTLRIRLEKTNGFTAEDRIRFVRDLSPAEINVQFNGLCWDNEERKYLVIFRSSDQGNNTLYYRSKGAATWLRKNFDGRRRTGEFLLGRSELGQGDFEFFIENENFAGLKGISETYDFSFEQEFIPQNGFVEKAYKLPAGFFLQKIYDLDQDQQAEVVMNQYDERLSFGQLNSYEFRGGMFVKADSVSFRQILIPRDLEDVDQDGNFELLATANDSSFLLTQESSDRLPSRLVFSDEGQGRFAARLANTDMDPQLEIITKNEKDYFVLDGNNYSQENLLEDNSGGYFLGIAPRILVEDFDGDGKNEVLFGDFDGDILIYEFDGANYQRTFLDTTDLTRSGNMLTAGDFNGDGRLDFFVATYPDFNENEDKENNIPYMVLRIFSSTGDNQYEIIWQDALYDVDTDKFNSASAGNIDNDPADELIIGSAPRTFVLDFQNGNFVMDWFFFGSQNTHHIIHDFDGNGIQEVGIGIGDTTYFFEKEINNNGPAPVEQLQGFVLGPNSIRLNWSPSPGANSYEIWRVRDPFNNDQAEVIQGYTGTEFLDTQLDEDMLYLYVLKSSNGIESSGFGNLIFLLPHPRPKLDSANALSETQLELFFSENVVAREEDKAKILLDGQHSPSSILQKGPQSNSLILSFEDDFETGIREIRLDSSFLDSENAAILPSFTTANFSFEADTNNCLILENWEIAGDKEALLYFTQSLDEAIGLDTSNYSIAPFGSITSIEWADDKQKAVRVTISQARMGALGYAVSITADVCTPLGVCTCGEGNTATFSSFKNDLSEVFVYPNPYTKNEYVDGVRFAHLTKQATIEVYSLSGRFIKRLEENDGDGGLEWNLQDETGVKLKPGVYLYKVSTRQEGVESILKKFTVVE